MIKTKNTTYSTEEIEQWFKECIVIQQMNRGEQKEIAEAFARGSWLVASTRLPKHTRQQRKGVRT